MAKMQQLRNIVNNTPADATDVAWNYNTIQNFVNNDLLNRDGTVSMQAGAQLTLSGNPVGDLDAASKQYVDSVLPVGMMVDYGGATAPSGWLLCDGQILVQASYPALFSVLGTSFNTGGEGGTQFRLPDFTDKVAVGPGDNAVGATGGAKDTVLPLHDHGSTDHYHTMPSHGHTLNSHTHNMGAHVHSISHNHAAFNTSSGGSHGHDAIQNNYGADSAWTRYTGNPSDPQNILSLYGGLNGFVRGVWSSGSDHAHSIDVPNFSGNSGSMSSASPTGSPNNNSTSSVNPGNTDAFSAGGDPAGVSPTDANYPPFVTVTKIIKAA